MGLTKDDELHIFEILEKTISSNISDYLLLGELDCKPITEERENEAMVMANWMSFILLTNLNTMVSFKFYYDMGDLGIIVQKQFEDNEKSQDLDFIKDYMKELANTLGGRINELLQAAELELIMSSPFIATGFDDIFFETQSTQFDLNRTWQIKNKDHNFYFSLEIICHKESDLEQFKKIEAHDEHGDIDFF